MTLTRKDLFLSVKRRLLRVSGNNKSLIIRNLCNIRFREELDAITKKLSDVTKLRDKAIEEATLYKMKNMERDRFLSREAQMSMAIEDLHRELNKQKLILNQTSMAKLADTVRGLFTFLRLLRQILNF